MIAIEVERQATLAWEERASELFSWHKLPKLDLPAWEGERSLWGALEPEQPLWTSAGSSGFTRSREVILKCASSLEGRGCK